MSVPPARSAVGSAAPKQSEVKLARDFGSWKPTVAGLSNSGGRNACSVRSPTSRL
jgi:hypothetical protein